VLALIQEDQINQSHSVKPTPMPRQLKANLSCGLLGKLAA